MNLFKLVTGFVIFIFIIVIVCYIFIGIVAFKSFETIKKDGLKSVITKIWVGEER